MIFVPCGFDKKVIGLPPRLSKDARDCARVLKFRFDFYRFGEKVLLLRIAAGILLGIWLVLVLLGKGGFVHILLLNGIAVAVVEIVCVYRRQVKARDSELENH
ncbi:MAG: hypothetical protein ACR2GD_07170 [Pyrinomonadaceae bacterium]